MPYYGTLHCACCDMYMAGFVIFKLHNLCLLIIKNVLVETYFYSTTSYDYDLHFTNYLLEVVSLASLLLTDADITDIGTLKKNRYFCASGPSGKIH